MAGRQQIAGTKFVNINYYYDKVTVVGEHPWNENIIGYTTEVG